MAYRLIKRYRNRRLYDLQASRTITQADLAGMIKEGHRVKVVDSTTQPVNLPQILSYVGQPTP